MTLSIFFKIYFAGGMCKVADDIYDDMLRRGRVKPDVQLLNSLINVFVKVRS